MTSPFTKADPRGTMRYARSVTDDLVMGRWEATDLYINVDPDVVNVFRVSLCRIQDKTGRVYSTRAIKLEDVEAGGAVASDIGRIWIRRIV